MKKVYILFTTLVLFNIFIFLFLHQKIEKENIETINEIKKHIYSEVKVDVNEAIRYMSKNKEISKAISANEQKLLIKGMDFKKEPYKKIMLSDFYVFLDDINFNDKTAISFLTVPEIDTYYLGLKHIDRKKISKSYSIDMKKVKMKKREVCKANVLHVKKGYFTKNNTLIVEEGYVFDSIFDRPSLCTHIIVEEEIF